MSTDTPITQYEPNPANVNPDNNQNQEGQASPPPPMYPSLVWKGETKELLDFASKIIGDLKDEEKKSDNYERPKRSKRNRSRSRDRSNNTNYNSSPQSVHPIPTVTNNYYGSAHSAPSIPILVLPQQPIIINKETESISIKKRSKNSKKEDDEKEEEKPDTTAIIISVGVVTVTSFILGSVFGEYEKVAQLMKEWHEHQEKWRVNQFHVGGVHVKHINNIIRDISIILDRRYKHLLNKGRIAGSFAVAGTLYGAGSWFLLPAISTFGLMGGFIALVGTAAYVGYRMHSTGDGQLISNIRHSIFLFKKNVKLDD